MFGAFDFCLPTRGTKVPDRAEWIHEVKYDGYRLRVERDGNRVRLVTRGGYDWTKRYPWIVEAALKTASSISSSTARPSSSASTASPI
jgi:bifunctional non-homologous end joining protein LigD